MASKDVQVSNELNFDELVLGAKGPVLVDFTATWCSHCKLQAAILEQLALESLGATIVKVDTDDSHELAARYGVRGMPTLVMFRGGKETGRRLGLTREAGVRALVSAAQATPAEAVAAR
jgi:thioredoxin 1